MSIWIRAVCTKSVGDVSPEDLRAGIAARLPRMAALYGEDDPEATIPRLRVEPSGSAGEGGFGVLLLRYAEGDDRFLRVERWAERERVDDELGELRDDLEESDEDEVDTVLACLDAAVETVAIELQMSDTEGIGWPLAMAAAAFLAERGAGLIQAENEGWLAPRGLDDVEHLLDND
jgi:hypothetical protein